MDTPPARPPSRFRLPAGYLRSLPLAPIVDFSENLYVSERRRARLACAFSVVEKKYGDGGRMDMYRMNFVFHVDRNDMTHRSQQYVFPNEKNHHR